MQSVLFTGLVDDSCCSPPALLVGIGLRSAIDIGAHREGFYKPDRPFENQMWKRVVWFVTASLQS